MLVVAALAVAVIAFVIASPGSDQESAEQAARMTTETETEVRTETATETATDPAPEPPPEPKVTSIRIQSGQVVGGSKTIEAAQGEQVRVVISSDAGDELHLHGYDITRNAEPGKDAVFAFKANLEGVFELESHVAADAGLNPLVAKLVVNPS